jgi:hypothetical protein
MSGPTLIAKILPRASQAIMGKDRSKARLSIARLIDQWEHIIAPEDPLIVRPIRVGWKKTGNGEEREGTLYIAAPSAIATKLTFQEAIIVGRVNRLFGMPASASVRRIALSHDRLSTPLKKSYRPKVPMAEDTRQVVENIEDPVLREMLKGLAEAMAGDKRS